MSQETAGRKASGPRFRRRRLVAIGAAAAVVVVAVVLALVLLDGDAQKDGAASGGGEITQVTSPYDFSELPAEDDPQDVKGASRVSIYLTKATGPFMSYQQMIYSADPVAKGRHTLTITCSGEKNSASEGSYIAVDAFDLAGSLTSEDAAESGRFQESDARFVYSGDWTRIEDDSASGGSFMRTDAPGAAVSIVFYGTNATGGNHLAWIGETGSEYGTARVSLDGATPVEVDLYRGSTSYGIDAALPAGKALLEAVRASVEVDAATLPTQSTGTVANAGSATTSSLTFVYPNRGTLTFDLYPAENLIARGGRVWKVEADLQTLILAVAKADQSQALASP